MINADEESVICHLLHQLYPLLVSIRINNPASYCCS